MSVQVWELVFMMFVLKLPIAYLIGVVWWAVRAQPDPFEPSALVPAGPDSPQDLPPPERCPWNGRRRGVPRTRNRQRPGVGAR